MRWLLDQGLPRRAALALREAGCDAIHVGGIGMAGLNATHQFLVGQALEERAYLMLVSTAKRAAYAHDHLILSIAGPSRAVASGHWPYGFILRNRRGGRQYFG